MISTMSNPGMSSALSPHLPLPTLLYPLTNESPSERLTDVFRFFAEGYAAGHAHGKLHGTFEGREIGREKAFELWEEVGYYEGWAGFWIEVLQRKGVMDGGRGKESRWAITIRCGQGVW